MTEPKKKRRKRILPRKVRLGINIALAAAAAVAGVLFVVCAAGVRVPFVYRHFETFKKNIRYVPPQTAVPSDAESPEETGVIPIPLEDITYPSEDDLISRPEHLSPPSEDAKRKQSDIDGIEYADVSGDWRLILVNPTHRLPEDYEVDTCKIVEDEVERIDWRIFDDLTDMILDCERAGHSPIIRAAYRTESQQEELFEQKVSQFMDEGETREEAMISAATIVAVPGTSEHQLGLAVDIVSGDDTVLREAQEDTPTQKWLMEHSWEYGFVLRYPTDKSGMTGIIYEPWHYRYVGHEAAKVMYEQDLCLEEYVIAHRSEGQREEEEDYE